MIRILRPITLDEVYGARFDKIIRETMEERGYKLGHTGSGIQTRFMEFDGTSMEVEHRDFMNAILADVLSTRLPNTYIEVSYVPGFSRPLDTLRPI